MSLARCRAALTKLQEFRAVEGPRHPLEWMKKSNKPGELVRLAVGFAHELVEAGAGDELTRRATLFDALTGPGSTFDEARQGADARLNCQGCTLKLPDYSAPSPGPGRLVAETLGDGSFMFVRNRCYPNCVDEIRPRVVDRDWARWHLPILLDDVQRLLDLEMSDSQRQDFQRWQHELWSLSIRSDREHLFGCYLLAECWKALEPNTSSPERCQRLEERFAKETERLAKVMQDAAEYLYLLAQEEHGQAPVGAPSSGAPAIRTDWFHTQDENRPSRYAHGPVAGSLKQLAAAICPSFNYRRDPRSLKLLGRKGPIWIEKVSGHSYKVFFEDQKLFAEANFKLWDSRNRQQQT